MILSILKYVSLLILLDIAKCKVERPSLGRTGGAVASVEERVQNEKYSQRVKEKKMQHPELFASVSQRVLGPMKTTYPPEKAECGQTLLHDRIVTTAIVVTDPLVAKFDIMTKEESDGSTEKDQDIHKTSKDIEKKMADRLNLIQKRHTNVRDLMMKLPLAYEKWPSILAGACPVSFMTQGDSSHKASERGVSMAHFQVWQDWFYRHNEAELALMTEEELQRSGTGRIKEHTNVKPRCKIATPPSYHDLYSNPEESGELSVSAYKDTKKKHSNDLLVVFEDDAKSNIDPALLGPALIRELDNMRTSKTDLLFLGWCHGKGMRAMPMCAHAYVITRKMAGILMQNWEPCGASVDGQWHALARRKLITWAKVHHESYNGTAEANLQDIMDGAGAGAGDGAGADSGSGAGSGSVRKATTGKGAEKELEYFRGMFAQGRMGSFNSHDWMPNAI